MKTKTIIFFLLLLGFFSNNIKAQPQKVALVLSGGGSKGLAHIGVIKALEEQNIPKDYIVGSSMGAIIGGLYAAGYTTEQMEKIFMSEDFVVWMSGKIDPKNTYYFRKGRDNSSWFSLDFDFKQGFAPYLPTNIVSPVLLDYMFMNIYSGANAAAKGNFDSLFIPFRCTGSDIEHTKTTYFDKGNLGNSIRASMTFPLFFSPIVIDSILYFDGGIYDNFPLDYTNKEFNPDLIIGSNVSLAYKKKVEHDELNSFLELLVMKENKANKDCKNCIIIEPEVDAVLVTDFSQAKQFIKNGYDAVYEKLHEIKANLATFAPECHVEDKRAEFVAKIPPLIFDTIAIHGLNSNQQIYISKLLSDVKDNIVFEETEEAYTRIASDPVITYIYPWAVYDSVKKAFEFNIYAENSKKFSLDIGGNISSSSTSQAFMQLNYASFGKNIFNAYFNTYVGRFYNSVEIGAIQFFPLNFPFFTNLTYTYNTWNYFKTSTFFVQDDSPMYLIEKEMNIDLGVGVPIGNMFKTSLHFIYAQETYEYYQDNSFTKYDTADITKFYPGIVKWKLEGSTFNFKQYPNKGMKWDMSVKYVFGPIKTTPGSTNTIQSPSKDYLNYITAELAYNRYFQLGKRYTLGFLGDIYVSTQPLLDNYLASVLNADVFYPTIESMTIFLPQFHANQYAAVGLQNVIRVFKNFDFRCEGYIFQPYKTIINDNLKPKYSEAFEYRNYALSFVLVYHTPVGPASLAINKYDNFAAFDNKDLYFSFNIGFTLFNKRGLN